MLYLLKYMFILYIYIYIYIYIYADQPTPQSGEFAIGNPRSSEGSLCNILLNCVFYTLTEMKSKSFLSDFTTLNLKTNKIKIGAI